MKKEKILSNIIHRSTPENLVNIFEFKDVNPNKAWPFEGSFWEPNKPPFSIFDEKLIQYNVFLYNC